MTGEIEAEGAVSMEDGGVDGAIEEGKDGVWRRWDNGVLDVGQYNVVVGLEDGARGHVGVVDSHCLGLVVYGLDLVVAVWGYEEEGKGGGVAREHVPELWGPAPVVDPEWVVDRDRPALVPARGVGEGGEGEEEEEEEAV